MFFYMSILFASQPCTNIFDRYAPGLYIPDNTKSIDCSPKTNEQPNLQPITQSQVGAPQQYSQPNTFQSQGNYQQTPMQFPTQTNTSMSMISPMYTQAPGNNVFTSPCDNSMETEKFKNCVQNSIKSLKGILANCRKTLGEDAPECCIDDKCLETLKKRKEKCNEELVERVIDRKGDSLQEFLNFLRKEIESKESRRPKSRGRRRRDYRDDDRDRYPNDRGDNYGRSERKTDKCKDPCENK